MTVKTTNKFIDNFNRKLSIKKDIQQRAIDFSDELIKILGIDEGLLDDMANEGHTFRLGNVVEDENVEITLRVGFRYYSAVDGWETIVDAVPSDKAFLDFNFDTFGEGKYFAAVPVDDVREQIIDAVKDLVKDND